MEWLKPRKTMDPPPDSVPESNHDKSSPHEYSFLEAQSVINETIAKAYVGKDFTEIPPIKFNRTQNGAYIEFDTITSRNFFRILGRLTSMLGEFKISSFTESFIYLKSKDFGVDFSAYSSDHGSIKFTIYNNLDEKHIESIIQAYELANLAETKFDPVEELTKLGATVYDSKDAPSWDYIGGYEEQKQLIRETVVLPLAHPKIYEQIVKGTRKIEESNKPRAALFEGPPGTGKTTSARIIAGQVNIPLVYVPIESIMSKWYSESGSRLADIFWFCKELGCIMFLDEIDSLASSRDKDMHEETKRVLSVLLRQIDGFNQDYATILIGATNRKEDLDSALLDRFGITVSFPLPNLMERESIFANYAKHLDPAALKMLADKTEGKSGRNIKQTCELVERKWAAEIITENGEEKSQEMDSVELPPLEKYLEFVK